MRNALLLLLVLVAALGGGCSSAKTANSHSLAGQSATPIVISGHARLASGNIPYDLYLPASKTPAPLIVVAHGFTRRSGHMVGWGKRLSEEGYVAIVPQMPSWFDNFENARVLNDLVDWTLTDSPDARQRVDGRRIGLMGLSAGGLTTLLAAADNPKVKLWVGLDPVDHANLGLAAAPRYRGMSVVLRATPSAWNGNANALAIEKALPAGCKDILIPDSVHIDAEWPTDMFAQLAIGISKESSREAFAKHAIESIKEAFPHTGTVEITASSPPTIKR